MKSLILFLTLAFVINSSSISAQSCSGGIFFFSQAEVDQFLIDNPTCTEIVGDVYIPMSSGEDPIMNVDGLQNITTIDGHLTIDVQYSGIGVSLLGLNSLTSVFELTIVGAGEPFSLNGLNNIQNITFLSVNASAVVDLHAFDNLTEVDYLALDFNQDNSISPTTSFYDVFPSLLTVWQELIIGNSLSNCDSLTGFNAVTNVGSLSFGNYEPLLLNHFDGLHNLQYLEYSFYNYFWIATSISGFENLVSAEYIEMAIECPCDLPDFESLSDVGNTYLFNFVNSLPDFPALIEVDGSVGVGGSSNSVGFVNLEIVHGDLSIAQENNSTNYNISEIHLDSLRIVDGGLSLLGTQIDHLDFLANLESVGVNVDISVNPNLTDCEVAYLCEQIPLAPEMFNITNNGPGCSSIEEVQSSCGNSFVTGEVFYDLDCDGTYNNNDVLVSNPVILNQSNLPVGGSNNNGYYFIPLNDNSTTILSTQGYPGFSATPQTLITGIEAEAFSNINFALCPQSEIHNLTVSVSHDEFRAGFYSWYTISVHNYSTAVESAEVTLTLVDMPDVSVNIVNNDGVVDGNTITWNVNDIPALSMQWVSLQFYVGQSTPLGQQLTTQVDVAVNPATNIDLDPSDNRLTSVHTVIGSYDPNDISVNLPAYSYTELQVEETIPLDYTIRFQNTGTADAVNVRVVNPIDEKLDLASFEILHTSHPATLQFNENNESEWLFENIMLPDSNSNEEESHGFIQYRIRTLSGLFAQDIIESTAAIYFDFNDPVITNTATTVIYECPEALVITEDGNNCEGYSLIALATYGWDEYSWTIDGIPAGNGLGITLENTVAGTYNIVCQANTMYCEESYTHLATIVETPNAPVITQDGNTLTASGSGDFQWTYNEEDMSETGNTINIVSSGDYGVFVTSNGCSSPQTNGYYIFTSIEEIGDPNTFDISPNPMHQKSTITFRSVDLNSILVIADISGKIVKELNINANNIYITDEGLERGVYFVSLRHADQKISRTMKLVVE